MAHYAFLDENNVVVEVIVGRDEDDTTGGVTDWEQYYSEFRGQVCKRTSYNTYREYEYIYDPTGKYVVEEIYIGSAHRGNGVPFRGQYANIGDIYDEQIDEFITPSSK